MSVLLNIHLIKFKARQQLPALHNKTSYFIGLCILAWLKAAGIGTQLLKDFIPKDKHDQLEDVLNLIKQWDRQHLET